ENVNKMAERFLDYIIDNNRVNQERVTLIQAFEISVCWIAASLLKHKLDRKVTLKLAKQYLNFECTEEEVLAIYDMLRKKKKPFLRQTENVNQSTDEPARVTDNVKPHMHARAQSEMPVQQDLEGGEIRGTPQSQHSSNESVPIKQLATDSEDANGSPNNEICKSISLVRKIHSERWLKLVAYQTKESKEFEEQRVKIEKEQIATLDKVHKFESALIRRLHHHNSVRLEKLKKVDQDFNSKKDIIKNHMDAELKKLESLHLAAKNEETRLKHHWLREAKSGRSVDSYSALPQSLDSRFKLVTVQLNEQGPSKEPITGGGSSPRLNDMGVTGHSGTVRGVDGITPTERLDNFVKSTLQSTDPLPSVQSNDDTTFTQPDVQFQLEDLESCEQGFSEEPVLDRYGSLRDSATGDAGPSEIVRGHEPVTEVIIPTEPLKHVNSTFQSTDLLPCNPSNDDSSVQPAVQSHLRDLERPSEEPVRLTEMGVARSPGTVRGHEPVVMDSIPTDPLPCDRSEDATIAVLPDMQFPVEGSEISDQGPSKESDVERTGSLGPSEVRVSEVPGDYEQVVEGTLPAERLPTSAPVNPPSAIQSELPTATVSCSDLLESNQSYNDNSVFSHAGSLQTAAPANPPREPLLANSSSHDTSVLPPAMQLDLPTLVDSLLSEQSRVPTDPLVGSGTRLSDTRSMTSSRTSQSPLPQDPLCYELARIRKEEEQVVKIHEEL
ncbi:hypothetical protein MKW92_037676, partial [Papaver armeniacum]